MKVQAQLKREESLRSERRTIARRDWAWRGAGKYETKTKMLISIKSIYIFIAWASSGFSARLNAVQLNTEIGNF